MTRLMRWTVETGDNLILRTCVGNAPLGIVGPIQPGTEWYEEGARGFMAIVLQPGYPSRGPYRNRTAAAEWLQAWVKHDWFSDAEFGAIPANSRDLAQKRAAS